MVCVIMLCFIVCWAPLQVLILFAQFSHDTQESGEVKSIRLADAYTDVDEYL